MVRALLVTALGTIALAAAIRLDPLQHGLVAEYFANPASTPPASFSRLDARPSSAHLVGAWSGSPPPVFSVRWTGAVNALRADTYAFATVSDGRSRLFVDGAQVVDNPGGEATVTGAVHLDRGAHAVVITYVHDRDRPRFDLLWSRGGAPLGPPPEWAFRSRRAKTVPRLIASAGLDMAFAAAEWCWVILGVIVCAAAVWWLLGRVRPHVDRVCDWRRLRWVVAASVVLNLVGLWWGLPENWVPIEVTPGYVIDALDQHFSHGWFDAYPPFHFQVLGAVMSPVLVLTWLGRIRLDPVSYTLMVVLSRLFSVAAAAGVVVAASVSGAQAFGRRTGLVAGAIVALITPLVYYAKTANVDVPYVCWFALSLVFYLRLLDGARLRDFLLYAVFATLAVCTKDQAYGLYLLAPLVIVLELWRLHRAAGRTRPLARAVTDRRLIAAAVTSAVLFALIHNLAFNLGGFIEHVRFITGPGAESYRMYPQTVFGHVQLAGLTLQLVRESLGWPLFVLCAAGVAIAAMTQRLRRRAFWLAVPLVSYYLTFINVILYNYDRFVIPMCVVLALFGGLAVVVLLDVDVIAAPIRRAAVAGVFAYTLLYAGTVDVLMVRDSRYAVERWMREHVGPDDLVGISGLSEYLPRLDGFRSEEISTIDAVERERPAYVVLNADYARAVPLDTGWGQMIAALHDRALGYRLVFSFREQSPWPWLPGAHPDLVGTREDTFISSTLRNINPTIEIFRREAVGARRD